MHKTPTHNPVGIIAWALQPLHFLLSHFLIQPPPPKTVCLNKLVKPCKRVQSQGRLKKWHTAVASLRRIACLVVEIVS